LEYSDFLKFTNLLFKHHIKQGWDQEVLNEVFESALTKLFKTSHNPIPIANGPAIPANPQECLFYHMEFHPRDIPHKQVRRIYQETGGDILRAEIGIEQFTTALPSKNNWEFHSKSQTVRNRRQ